MNWFFKRFSFSQGLSTRGETFFGRRFIITISKLHKIQLFTVSQCWRCHKFRGTAVCSGYTTLRLREMISSIAYFSNKGDNFFHYFKRLLTIFSTSLYRSFVAQWLRCQPCNSQIVSSNLTGVLFLFFTGFFKTSEKNCGRYLKNLQLIKSFSFR